MGDCGCGCCGCGCGCSFLLHSFFLAGMDGGHGRLARVVTRLDFIFGKQQSLLSSDGPVLHVSNSTQTTITCQLQSIVPGPIAMGCHRSTRSTTHDFRKCGKGVRLPPDPGVLRPVPALLSQDDECSVLQPCLQGLSSLPALQGAEMEIGLEGWKATFNRIGLALPEWARQNVPDPDALWRLFVDPAFELAVEASPTTSAGRKWAPRGPAAKGAARGFGRLPCLPYQPGRAGAGLYITKKKGYLQVRLTSSRKEAAHRLVCAARHGPPPPRCRTVMHLCDNPTCLAPGHLAWGSEEQNHYLNGADKAYWAQTFGCKRKLYS